MVLDAIPIFNFDPYRCKFGSLLLEPLCAQDRSYYDSARRSYLPGLSGATSEKDGVDLVELGGEFCGSAECSMARGSELLYRDWAHVNENGQRIIVERLLADVPALAR